jgi:multidrug transporter EmrE-like cation transporter
MEHSWAVIGILTAANLLFNVIANASFKVSADSRTWREFLFWQVIGNVAGLITVLTLTGLLRFLPLHVAFPLTTGLMVIGVQVGAAYWLFHEPITPIQWGGTLLVAIGILLIGAR